MLQTMTAVSLRERKPASVRTPSLGPQTATPAVPSTDPNLATEPPGLWTVALTTPAAGRTHSALTRRTALFL